MFFQRATSIPGAEVGDQACAIFKATKLVMVQEIRRKLRHAIPAQPVKQNIHQPAMDSALRGATAHHMARKRARARDDALAFARAWNCELPLRLTHAAWTQHSCPRLRCEVQLYIRGPAGQRPRTPC